MGNIENLLKENNAMLKVLLRNQALIMAVLDEAIDKINEDSKGVIPETTDKLLEIREKMAELQFRKLTLQTKVFMNE